MNLDKGSSGSHAGRNLYLISFDLDRSTNRTNDYNAIKIRIARLGLSANPTMQIRLLVHPGDAALIRSDLYAATFEGGMRKGQSIFQAKDRIFVMRLEKPAAWNRLKDTELVARLNKLHTMDSAGR